jgi:hypothetical protein
VNPHAACCLFSPHSENKSKDVQLPKKLKKLKMNYHNVTFLPNELQEFGVVWKHISALAATTRKITRLGHPGS